MRDFFTPCLGASVLYRRAAGYFTSASLALAARGVASLASRHGKMRLVVSPHLEPDDIAALRRAQDNPSAVLRSIVARGLDEIEDALVRDRLNALSWLAAAGMLEIKLAVRIDAESGFRRGLFHVKTGVFSDTNGAHVAFTGSANETAGGLLENFEHLEVFRSWTDPEARVQAAIEDFETLWQGKEPSLRVIEFSKASAELLERYRDPNSPPLGLTLLTVREPKATQVFAPPPGLELRSYQKNAIRAWSQAGGKGILAMATGAGKTLTALVLASKVAERNHPLVIIIVCPFINLCLQWTKEVAAFGAIPIGCFEARAQWQRPLDEAYQRLSAGLDAVQVIVTTNATFQGETFQRTIAPRIAAGTIHHLLIADEVHNLGADRARAALPDGIALRLGLSATPERHFDPEGTSAVLDYFGGIQFEYDLTQAIAEGRLSPYRYYPIPVELTDEETDEYLDLTAKLAKFIHGADSDSEINQSAMRLLVRRARLLGAAANKLNALDTLLAEMDNPPKKAIFYCGDGRTTDQINKEETRQIQAVARLLGERHQLRVRNFTYREGPAERDDILRDFRSGFLDGIVAIRCLDEGIDLPDLRIGFLLASSTNPRQFIQRRGRLLRNAPDKPYAIIYDFMVVPPDMDGGHGDAAFNLERRFLERELARVGGFCTAALNNEEAMGSLLDIRMKYNLLAFR
nr:DEAD/DEAH box helicase family protein [Thioflavicoccus mobilis]